MKFLDFVKKHMIASFAIAVGVVAIAVAGINYGVSKAKYNNYYIIRNIKFFSHLNIPLKYFFYFFPYFY